MQGGVQMWLSGATASDYGFGSPNGGLGADGSLFGPGSQVGEGEGSLGVAGGTCAAIGDDGAFLDPGHIPSCHWGSCPSRSRSFLAPTLRI